MNELSPRSLDASLSATASGVSCPESSPPPTGIGPLAGSAGPLGLGRLCVLIVDDDALSRQLLQSLLEAENHEVLLAENGDDGLALATRHRPDVVLLDVLMPGRDGYDVCRQLRADPALQQLHVLLLTSLGGRTSRLCGLDAGADDFLNKPVDLLELRTRLRTIARLNRFRQLSEERARFAAAVAHAPDGIALANAAGEILHANLALQRMTRTRCRIFDLFPADLCARLGPAIATLVPGAAAGPFHTPLLRTPQPIEAEITVVRLPSSSPSPHGAILQFIVRDMTERKRLETQLLRSQRVELLGQVAGGIVHDVNNLLTAISGHAGLLLLGDSSPVADHARVIQESAQRGGALLRQILAFARGADTAMVPTELATVTAEALQIARQLIGRHTTVEFTAAPAVPRILADANQLHQIILNLCVNSRDAMPGGGTLGVSVNRTRVTAAEAARLGADAREGEFVALAVRDTGVGIPLEVRARLFDPFFTTKPPGAGTGLGLATVHRLVRAHDGFIGLESEVGRGTCFTCYLPLPATELDDSACPVNGASPAPRLLAGPS